MATIPSGELPLAQSRSNERLQPLFCVGIHDIDHMSSLRGGFVACKLARRERRTGDRVGGKDFLLTILVNVTLGDRYNGKAVFV